MIGAYGALACCLYACYRFWRDEGWFYGLVQLLVLIGFGVLYWLLESWANHRAPFYNYPSGLFPDMIPHFNPGVAIGSPDPCVQSPSARISLSIPISGACITFCLMWTARQLVGVANWYADYRNAIVAPILVGAAALLMDSVLDPVLASSYSCNIPIEQLHPGAGFWTWHTGDHLADIWFNVPLYNFSVWFAGPAILVAVMYLVHWIILLIRFGIVSADPRQGLLRSFVLTMVVMVFYVSPTSANDTVAQIAMMVLIISSSVGVLIAKWPSFVRNNPYKWYFVVPLTFYFVFPLLLMLFGQGFVPMMDHLQLLGVATVVAVAGIYLAVSPYWSYP